jgi:hypothetical protein
MTPTPTASLEPAARKEYLNRIAALSPWPGLTAELWNKVHEEIQEQLEILDTEVRQKMAGIRVVAGRTKGEKFFLFSYRIYSMPDSGIDPVVVGITFTQVERSVAVDADVSGEQTGDCISDISSKAIANSWQELLAVAHDSAEKLSHSAEAVAEAIQNQSRKEPGY